MRLLSLDELTELRVQANIALSEYREAKRWSETGITADSVRIGDTKLLLTAYEEKIERAIAMRNKAPSCPFCKQGAVGETKTHGRLECVDCMAVMLKGRI